MERLIDLFQPLCKDTETMAELRSLLGREKDWGTAHYISSRIRIKTMAAGKSGDHRAEAQYGFEEICAQTLHNMSGTKKPFSADTAYWIIPQALKLAKALEVDPQKVVEIAMS
jgi:hypothetical protein